MNQQEFEQAFSRLTPRRKEVLQEVLAGKTDEVIAKSLGIRKSTVRKHIERICLVFGLENERPDERRYKRDQVFALIAKYKLELLRDWTPISTNEVAVAKKASTKGVSEKRRGETSQQTRRREYTKMRRIEIPPHISPHPLKTTAYRNQIN